MDSAHINVVGVQFRRAGRIYDFATGELNLRVGDDVVVETDRGPSLAKVAHVEFAASERFKEQALKAVLRLATERDMDEARRLTPEHAVEFSRELVEKLGLKMTVLQAEIQFGGNKAILYFSAPGRVDFRELVKDLASGLKARVELKQVGARDEAKLVGGIGICGREYCCSSFLRDFLPVSIKMAKNQNLALNPSKVSGGCGRLLCCLTYENDQYTELRRQLPSRGTRLRVKGDHEYGSVGKVLKGDVLNQVVMMETDDGRFISVKLSDTETAGEDVRSGAADEAEDWASDIDLDVLQESATPAAAPQTAKPETAKPETARPETTRPETENKPEQQARAPETSHSADDSDSKKKRRRGKRRGGRGRNNKGGGGDSSTS
jgi:cell fate regulator YaaT (PSP1 superfamily)